MSGRQFDSTENAELRAKIDKAKPRLPVPKLMRELGYGERHIGKEAVCPFHDDEHPSFSVFQSSDGKGWQWKCHVGCGYGDEIAFLVKHFNISRREAIKRYLEMAGFPCRVPRKSHEYPELPDSPKCLESLSVLVSESPCVSVSLVSNGQAVERKLDTQLQRLAASNACSRGGDIAAKKRFKLARDLRAFEMKLGRKLSNAELMLTFDGWQRLSQSFLGAAETRDDHLAAFLAELEKVRVPTGEGTLTKAVENVPKVSLDQLPMIPGYANAPENWRRLAALHRELSFLSPKATYSLSYRDAAKVSNGLTQQKAHTITFALARLGVIEIVRKGKAGLNGSEAAEFRYLLSQVECPGGEDDDKELIL
ncbi:MAG TPA: CHC2 zinc finger domain-containing protein [Candidatus Dormibacteraeota bacterium]|nr:CHC2 zinc finger domain-containing protein [Candidatus Dormibacteraeota bacterium]